MFLCGTHRTFNRHSLNFPIFLSWIWNYPHSIDIYIWLAFFLTYHFLTSLLTANSCQDTILWNVKVFPINLNTKYVNGLVCINFMFDKLKIP